VIRISRSNLWKFVSRTNSQTPHFWQGSLRFRWSVWHSGQTSLFNFLAINGIVPEILDFAMGYQPDLQGISFLQKSLAQN